jgi:hypothetical protein
LPISFISQEIAMKSVHHVALERAASALAAATLVMATPAFAHHGWSDYDEGTTLTLKGTIKSSSYENPHATIVLDSQAQTFTVVLAPVARMESRGASREAVAVGKEVTVIGYPSRTHAGEVRAERIVFKENGVDKTAEMR